MKRVEGRRAFEVLQSEGRPFDPKEFGFDFSMEEIEERIVWSEALPPRTRHQYRHSETPPPRRIRFESRLGAGRASMILWMSAEISRRARARQLASTYLAGGDPTGWFEQLYREAETDGAVIPWADLRPNPNLIEFWSRAQTAIPIGTAAVIGCGFGDDAEQLASWGFETTAFDISESAIRTCLTRFPASRVRYQIADLLNPPPEWIGKFDLVLEAYTLQVLPRPIRQQAIKRIANLISPGGFALVITRAREESEPAGDMPWPLTRAEMNEIAQTGLTEFSFEDYYDQESPPVRRFRGLYQRS